MALHFGLTILLLIGVSYSHEKTQTYGKSFISNLKRVSQNQNYTDLGPTYLINGRVITQNQGITYEILPNREFVEIHAIDDQITLQDDCTETALLFVPFGSNNPFHVIVDDILTLFVNAQKLLPAAEVILLVRDSLLYENSTSMEFYNTISSRKSVHFIDQQKPHNEMCFKRTIYVKGRYPYNHKLLRTGLGPNWSIKVAENELPPLHLEFSLFVQKQLGITKYKESKKVQEWNLDDHKGSKCKVGIISRRLASRRKLANEEDLSSYLSNHTHIDLHNIDLELMSINEQISTVSSMDVLIGMHGAGMVHFIWMEPQSLVLEIFPPGIYKETIRELAMKFGIHHAMWSIAEDLRLYENNNIHYLRDQNAKLSLDENFTTFLEENLKTACFNG